MNTTNITSYQSVQMADPLLEKAGQMAKNLSDDLLKMNVAQKVNANQLEYMGTKVDTYA